MRKAIYEILKDPKTRIKFDWIKKHAATIEKRRYGRERRKSGRLITMDIYHFIISNAIHECLHDLFPKEREPSIRRMEPKICKRLTRKQKVHILKLVLHNALRSVKSLRYVKDVVRKSVSGKENTANSHIKSLLKKTKS